MNWSIFFSFLFRNFRVKKLSQEEMFFQLAEKYGLYGKVCLHWEVPGGYTLIPIINGEEKPRPIPGRFLEEVIYMLEHGRIKKKNSG